MKIKVANYYSDGHHSTMRYTVPDIDLPRPLDVDNDEHLDQLWDILHAYTGDGHAADNAALGCLYEVEILDATDPRLIGLINEYA